VTQSAVVRRPVLAVPLVRAGVPLGVGQVIAGAQRLGAEDPLQPSLPAGGLLAALPLVSGSVGGPVFGAIVAAGGCWDVWFDRR